MKSILVVVDQMNSIATHTMKYSRPAVTKPMAVRKFTIIHLLRIAGLPSKAVKAK
jgi:hypothetical protein